MLLADLFWWVIGFCGFIMVVFISVTFFFMRGNAPEADLNKAYVVSELYFKVAMCLSIFLLALALILLVVKNG